MKILPSSLNNSDLKNKFVYYDRLKDDGPSRAALHRHISNRLNIVSEKYDIDEVVSFLKGQAEAEKKKEIYAIEQTWGIKIDEGILKDDVYKNIIEALNIKLQSQKIFQRNLARLEYEGKGQSKEEARSLAKIDVSKLFGEYFSKEFQDNEKRINDRIIARAQQTKDLEGSVKEILNEELTNITYNTLMNMYQSNTYSNNLYGSKQINEQTKGAYQEMLSMIERFGANRERNTFLNEVWMNYNFDQLVDDLTKEVKSNFNSQKKEIDLKAKINGKVKSSSLSGTFAEIQQITLAKLANELNGGNIQVEKTGSVNNMKADSIITFGADANQFINKFIDSIDKSNNSVRLQNIIANEEATKWLKNNTADFNFIMYVNDKNYTIDKEFFEGKSREAGFSAGAPINMDNFEQVVDKLPGMSQHGASTLIGALLQFGDGALGTQLQKEAILKNLSKAIAYFLFDDFTTIGEELNTSGSNSLHIFWLSGFYIPLSFLLSICADAIKIGWEQTDQYFKFLLNSPPILYPNLKLEEYTKEMWEDQSDKALKKTTLSLRFLRSFQELMKIMI